MPVLLKGGFAIKKYICYLIVFLIIPILSFAQSIHHTERDAMVEEAIYESLRHYEFADPKEDLKKAVSKNDYRFMFVCSYACEAPGVDDYYEKYSQRYAHVTIDDTGDDLLNSEHSRLKMIVYAYAEKYNELLITEIKKKDEG